MSTSVTKAQKALRAPLVVGFQPLKSEKVQNLLRNDMNSVYENVAKQFVNMTYTGIGTSDQFDMVISKLVVPSCKFQLNHLYHFN